MAKTVAPIETETADALDTVAPFDTLIEGDADEATAMAVFNGTADDMSVLNDIRDLASGTPAAYSSIKGDSWEERKAALTAVINSKPVSDNIGTVIQLKHIIVQSANILNKETGVRSVQPRVILIDEAGTAYHGTSKGLLLAIRNFINIAGQPHTWKESLPIAVRRERAATGHFFTIDIAG